MNKDDLELLSQAELIDILLNQAEQLARLTTALQKVQADYEALKMKFDHNRKPPTTSQNSSQPPSQDHKRRLPKDRHRKKHGPPAGHEKHERKFVAQADQVVEVRTQACPHCSTDLQAEAGQLVKVNQITELPEAPAQVIEVRQYASTCPQCQQTQVAQPPAGLEMQRTFGARLEATVAYYRQEQHLSYQRTQATLWDLHRVKMSQGGIDAIMKRTGQRALPQAAEIQTEIQHSRVVHSDETGSRVGGDNWWEWVFCSARAVLHVTRFNRSVDVIHEVMGASQAEVWVSDCWHSQLKAPARQRQLCLAHQLRNLQAVVDAYPPLLWPKVMQALFRHAIHLHHQQDQLSPEEFCTQVARVERICDRLLQHGLEPPAAQTLQHRYQKHRHSLFVFLYRTDVEPTNNVSERALRHSVVHRKVTGCFRSQWGSQAYAALASVIDTAELSGVRAFEAIQSLLGRPALPLPVSGE